MPTALSLHGVRVSYGPVEALHGVDLAFPDGAVTALLGRNGAGRSTLLRTLAGLLTPTAGRIEWDGRDITRWTAAERARDGLALIPDGKGVFGGLSVRDNLTVFAGGATDITPALDAFPVLRKRLAQRAGTLSGGEQQMLAVSRALLRPSRVLLLDELSQGLAPRVVGQLYEVVTQLAAEKRAVVLVEQYAGEALRRADVAYVLRRGQVAFAGEPGELMTDGHVSLFD
ncbi:ABC transporter ATP-binding protein [Yinghuangia seranimata]|uniref:ABC transporter ATP-binding protein n=1 Tax=Yinghuangia seranimata TaxID=408067 RepID=UPI00248B8E3B|nr:ABC transporter ATP-binding protein [Yinghuangia seranimata]MDI2126368.1 ABC transporter ATP-binding protein [Yinghuangia seranimata]